MAKRFSSRDILWFVGASVLVAACLAGIALLLALVYIRMSS